MDAVTWKKAQLRGKDLCHVDVKPETFAKAIADDVEWLTAHPTRRQPKRDDERD